MLLVMLGGLSYGQEAEEALRGLRAVEVSVSLEREFEERGLRADDLRDALLAELRRAGLDAFTADPASSPSGAGARRPQLVAHVAGVHQDSLTAYALRLYLYDTVCRPDRPDRLFVAAVWHAGGTGLVSRGNLGTLRAYLRGLAGLFIRDYLIANPE